MKNKKNRDYQLKNRLEKSKTINGKIAAAVILCCGFSAASLQVQAQNPIDVKVFFDSAGCPEYVDKPFFDLDPKVNGLKVKWTAVYPEPPSDQPEGAQAKMEYKIYFDPFQGGKPLESSSGIILSQPIERGIPTNVTYKYTIMGDQCTHKPLDPYFRVQ